MNYNEEMYELFEELGLDESITLRKLSDEEKATSEDYAALEKIIDTKFNENDRMLNLSQIYANNKTCQSDTKSDDLLNIPYRVIIANVFYATQNSYVSYKEIDEYKKKLFRALGENNRFVYFDSHNIGSRIEPKIIDIDNYIFIKQSSGITCVNASSFDNEFVNGVNHIFDEENIKIIEKVNREYIDAQKRLILNQK